MMQLQEYCFYVHVHYSICHVQPSYDAHKHSVGVSARELTRELKGGQRARIVDYDQRVLCKDNFAGMLQTTAQVTQA
jgi:hypothetical protein